MSTQFSYGGRDRVPGISASVETFENEFTWGPWPAQHLSGLVINGATRDTGNTGSTHILRAGLLLGLNNTTQELNVWDPTAVDGTEYIWGVLKESRSMLSNNTSTDRLSGPIVVAGGLISNRLIVPGTTALGLASSASLEYLARQQLRSRFVLNDDFQFARPEWTIHTVSEAEGIAGITLTARNTNREYQSEEAVTITLPATPYKGLRYRFFGNGEAITVASGSSNIKVPGASAANTLAVEDVIREVYGNGSQWVVLAYDVDTDT